MVDSIDPRCYRLRRAVRLACVYGEMMAANKSLIPLLKKENVPNFDEAHWDSTSWPSIQKLSEETYKPAEVQASVTPKLDKLWESEMNSHSSATPEHSSAYCLGGYPPCVLGLLLSIRGQRGQLLMVSGYSWCRWMCICLYIISSLWAAFNALHSMIPDQCF